MLKKYLRLYKLFINLNIQRASIYRADFFAWGLVSIGWFIFNVIFFQLLFTQVDNIGGWQKGNVFILQGFYFFLEFIIWGICFANLESLPRDINKGNIDHILTKPINSQFLLSFTKFNINDLINLVLGSMIIIYGFGLLQISPNGIHVIMSLIIFAISMIFFYAGYFITITSAFWFERLDPIVFIFPQIRQFSRIPRSALPGLAQKILTFVVPAAIITSVPAEVMVGIFSWKLIITLLIFAVVTLIASHTFFQLSLKQYTSASS